MKIEQKIIDRLTELIDRGIEIGKSYKHYSDGAFSFDNAAAIQWKISSLSFLDNIFGDGNIYSKGLQTHFKLKSQYDLVSFGENISFVKAAKEDYENGYLFETKVLIEAEVFDDFLEQAEELLKKKYHPAAAVISGSVLEDGLRKLCIQNNIVLSAKPKLDTMNSELAKAGVYNVLIQKRVTTLADLRNKAAHGQWNQFSEKDVEEMIRDVRRLMEEHFT